MAVAISRSGLRVVLQVPAGGSVPARCSGQASKDMFAVLYRLDGEGNGYGDEYGGAGGIGAVEDGLPGKQEV